MECWRGCGEIRTLCTVGMPNGAAAVEYSIAVPKKNHFSLFIINLQYKVNIFTPMFL
jgi:hypothetical protein